MNKLHVAIGHYVQEIIWSRKNKMFKTCVKCIWNTTKNMGNNQPFFEESCHTSEVVSQNPSQDEILPGRLFIFLQKWLVKKSQKPKT